MNYSLLPCSLFIFAFTGCGPGCTEEGCDGPPVEVRFENTSGLPFDEYTVTVNLGAEQQTCIGAWGIPGDGAGGAGGQSSTSDAASPSAQAMICDREDLFDLVLDDNRLPEQLTLRSHPQSFTLTISKSEIVVFSETMEPTYVESYPNGKKCDDRACRQATETVSLADID